MKEKVKGILRASGYMGIWLFVQTSVTVVMMIGAIVLYASGMTSEAGFVLGDNLEQLNKLADTILPGILIVSSFILMGLFWIITKCRKQKFREKVMLKKLKLRFILLGGVITFGMYCFNTALVDLLGRIDFLHNSYSAFTESSQVLVEMPIMLSILVVGIIAPISEEVLFRGFVYQTLKKGYSIRWTILLQGILFGLIHMNIVQAIYATGIGIILGYVLYRTGSLWTAITIHIINNVLSMILGKLLSGYNADALLTTPWIIILLIVGVSVTLIGIKFIYKYSETFKPSELEIEEGINI